MGVLILFRLLDTHVLTTIACQIQVPKQDPAWVLELQRPPITLLKTPLVAASSNSLLNVAPDLVETATKKLLARAAGVQNPTVLSPPQRRISLQAVAQWALREVVHCIVACV